MKGLAALTGAGRLHASKDDITHGQMAGKLKVQDQIFQLDFQLATC